MRKLLALAAVVAMTTPAFAGVTLDTRYDYFSAQGNSTYSSSTDYLSAFAFQRLRVGGNGALTDSVSFKTRLNLLSFGASSAGAQTVSDVQYGNSLKPATAPNSLISPAATGLLLSNTAGNQPNDLIDFAEADIKVSDSVTVQAGKLFDIGLSGFEGQVNPGDVSFLSQGYLANTWLEGAALVYSISDGQTLGLAMFNNNDSKDTSRTGAGIYYVGAFGNLGVRASYHSLPKDNTTIATGASSINNSASVGLTPITIGLSYKMDDWKFTLDADQLTYTSMAITGNNKVLTSFVGTAEYAMGNWTPSLKIESTSRTGFETATGSTSDVNDSISNLAVQLNYKKAAADNFRYELAYVSGTTNYASTAAYGGATASFNNATVNGQFAIASIRYLGDFLK